MSARISDEAQTRHRARTRRPLRVAQPKGRVPRPRKIESQVRGRLKQMPRLPKHLIWKSTNMMGETTTDYSIHNRLIKAFKTRDLEQWKKLLGSEEFTAPSRQQLATAGLAAVRVDWQEGLAFVLQIDLETWGPGPGTCELAATAGRLKDYLRLAYSEPTSRGTGCGKCAIKELARLSREGDSLAVEANDALRPKMEYPFPQGPFKPGLCELFAALDGAGGAPCARGGQ